MDTKTASLTEIKAELHRLIDGPGEHKKEVSELLCALRDRFPELYPEMSDYIAMWNTEITWGKGHSSVP